MKKAFTLPFIVVVSFFTCPAVWAETSAQVTVRGRNLPIKLSQNRSQLLRSTARTLLRNKLPGYAALYRAKALQGATLVIAVDRGPQLDRWFSTIGKKSIGFAIAANPNKPKGSTYVRVGKTLYYFRSLRGETHKDGRPSVPRDIREREDILTESTFPVTDAEMSALSAFYLARHHLQIKDDGGQPIVPTYKMIGASGRIKGTECCAQACTSAINPEWINAFEKNIPTISAYGREKGIPEMAAASPTMIKHLVEFGTRTAGLECARGRKSLVRANFLQAPLLTVFNRAVGSDPLNSLSWKGWKWNGLSVPKIWFDRAPNEKPTASFDSERVSLRDLKNQVRRQL
ncbi:MAG: hypothetical protein V1754_00675 [Pseudomonadota bacterium]